MVVSLVGSGRRGSAECWVCGCEVHDIRFACLSVYTAHATWNYYEYGCTRYAEAFVLEQHYCHDYCTDNTDCEHGPHTRHMAIATERRFSHPMEDAHGMSTLLHTAGSGRRLSCLYATPLHHSSSGEYAARKTSGAKRNGVAVEPGANPG